MKGDEDILSEIPWDFILVMLVCITAGTIFYFGLRWVKRKFKA